MGWRAILALLRLLPQGALSRAWGWLARRRLPGFLQAAANRAFARLVGVRLDEAESPPSEYPSLSQFFVRRLRPGLRTWPEDPGLPGSPVDGILGSFGELSDGLLVQAKGIRYSVARLLDDDVRAGEFRRGLYFTLYLSPRHYHRVHAPLSTELTLARAVPGRLLPVNRAAARTIPDLFPGNERLVTHHRHQEGRLALVAVGAYNVGGIAADFDPEWQAGRPAGVTNVREGVQERVYSPALRIRRGEELMTFHFGSTVILLLSSDRGAVPRPHPSLTRGMEIRLGTALLASVRSDPTAGAGRDRV